MFTLCFGVLLIILGALFWYRYTFLKKNKNKETDYDVGAWVLFVVGIIMLMLSIIFTMFSYSGQKDDYETLRKLKRYEAIYTNKANAMTIQFKAYLAEAYPQHEKDIFNKVTLNKPEIYLVTYPELRSVEGFIVLVGEIGKLQTDRYSQQLKREQVLKNMRFATKNPWIFYWWIPTLQELESKYGKVDK